jgi:hypothetical protein
LWELLTQRTGIPKLPAVESCVAKQHSDAPSGNDPKNRKRRQSAGQVEVEREGKPEEEK